jgi:hypothetical protein
MEMKKKGKKLPRRILPAEFWERLERTQRMLAERIAYHEPRYRRSRARRESRRRSHVLIASPFLR